MFTYTYMQYMYIHVLLHFHSTITSGILGRRHHALHHRTVSAGGRQLRGSDEHARREECRNLGRIVRRSAAVGCVHRNTKTIRSP